MSKRNRKRQRITRALFVGLLTLALVITSAVAIEVLRKRAAEGTPAQEALLELPTTSPALTPGIERIPATPLPTLPPLASYQPITLPSSTPVPMPAPKAIADAEPDYSFYYFTDTQYYARKYPDTFLAMTAWMRDNAVKYNVKYAFHTGDVVDSDSADQWKLANEAMQQLESMVPVFVIAGNHDVGTSSPSYTSFIKHFGPSRYQENPHIVSWFEKGKGRCDSVEIDGTKYLFIGLGWKSDTSAGIKWMNEQLAKHQDHHAILMFHDYMESDGLLSSAGEKLYESVVKANSNVFMVLCGHRYNCTLLTTDIHDNGDRLNYRRVYNILMNYQAFENGGDGYLALIRVYKKNRLLTIDTYSPMLNKWYQFDPSRNINREQLTLPVTIFD